MAGKFKNMNKASKNNMLTLSLVILFFVIFKIITTVGSSESLIGIFPMICYYIILAVSLNLVVGFLGELSLGHAAFMCVGAFSSGMFSKIFADTISNDWLRFLLAVVVGTLVGGIVGILVGSLVLRLRGDYLAVVTLAFGEVIRSLLNNLYIVFNDGKLKVSFIENTVTEGVSVENVIIKGATGMTKLVSVYKDFHRNNTFIILGMILVVVTLLIVFNFINSRSGRAVMAIRDNRIAAEASGINITKYRLMIYGLSSALAGMAGVLYIHFLGMAEPVSFDYNFSIEILVIVVLGGIGSIRGSIIAAAILTWLPTSSLFMNFDKYRMLIYSIVLIVMMLFTWNPKCKEILKKLSVKNLILKIFKKKKETVEETVEVESKTAETVVETADKEVQ
ncbi:MAG: branched-chain amino acid ABC transporter permease [Lachnospiraceae bacterium]|nr:branched-chain amino acid ABC transporter permease [Lachnospiraceae bacterium]